jgi:NAD(P)-dependent dehydrogenase (short-subunit alcohol dehydrogenase family)
VITGAARGLGFELVRQYSSAHSQNLIIAAVRDPSAKSSVKLTQLAQSNKNIRIVQLDVADETTILNAAKQVSALVSHIDILINNAGIIGEKGTGLTTTKSDLLDVYNTNVVGQILVIQNFLPLLKAASPAAKVVTISSGLGSNAHADALGPAMISYGISKAAVNFFNTAFANTVPELTFLSFSPGWVKTDMGSDKAPIEVADSVTAIRTRIQQKQHSNSGEFSDVISGNKLAF